MSKHGEEKYRKIIEIQTSCLPEEQRKNYIEKIKQQKFFQTKEILSRKPTFNAFFDVLALSHKQRKEYYRKIRQQVEFQSRFQFQSPSVKVPQTKNQKTRVFDYYQQLQQKQQK